MIVELFEIIIHSRTLLLLFNLCMIRGSNIVMIIQHSFILQLSVYFVVVAESSKFKKAIHLVKPLILQQQ